MQVGLLRQQRGQAKAHRIAAAWLGMAQHGEAPCTAEGLDLGRAGHGNAPGKHRRGGQRQRMDGQRPAVQLGHQLVAAEPPPQPRGHDDAAQRRHRAVQIVHKGVRVGAERAQERGVLLADDRENAADFQQIQHALLKIRAAALQIAKLVQHGPAAGRRHPLQGGQPHGGKAGRHGAHPVFTGGQGGIKPADDRRCPGGCIAHLDPSARDGSGEKHRGIGAEGWHKCAQQRCFAAAAPAGQQQVALTAG